MAPGEKSVQDGSLELVLEVTKLSQVKFPPVEFFNVMEDERQSFSEV